MAVGLAAELLESLSISATLVEGDKGIFDVLVDNNLLFSKFSTKRFPLLGELPAMIRDYVPPQEE